MFHIKPQVSIVTDSTCDLPKQLLDTYQIKVIPLKITLDGKAFRDGLDLTPRDFYRQLPNLSKLPVTSQPSPGEFQAVYETIAKVGQAVIAIHISGGLSGTVLSSELAGRLVPSLMLYVVDSHSTSLGLGLPVLAAAKAAQSGLGPAEVLREVQAVLNRTSAYFFLDTLDYIYKGGRIGRAAAFMGNLLNIKPLLTFSDGVVSPVDKLRGRHRAVERLLSLAKEEVGGNPIICSVFHGDDLLNAQKLYARAASELNCTQLFISEISPVLGTYAGPGALGLAYHTV